MDRPPATARDRARFIYPQNDRQNKSRGLAASVRVRVRPDDLAAVGFKLNFLEPFLTSWGFPWPPDAF